MSGQYTQVRITRLIHNYGTSPETNDCADFGHENGEENADDDNASVEDDDLPVAGEHGAIDRVENGNPAHKRRHFNQGCGSESGSGLDPDSIGSVDPDSESGSGSRRGEMAHKSRKNFKSSCFEMLDGLF
jgi:hypothetical protein